MKRRTFLAGLAAIAVSSKLPPLPAPDVTPALPALPAKIPGVISTPSGWCAPSETIYEMARIQLAGEGGLYGTFYRASAGTIDLRDELPQVRIRRGGIQFGEVR